MDTIKLLEYLQEIVDTAPKVPMTGKIILKKREIVDVLEKIVNYLPVEFKKAQWIVEEKEKILSDAIKESENMKKENLNILRRQIENHDVTKEANRRAAEIISSAKKNAKAIRLGARDYADDILKQLDSEISIKSDKMVSELRIQLQEFLDNLQGSVDLKTDSIRENIDELNNMK